MAQKCITDITAHPKYEMSPTEKEYREKYLSLLSKDQILKSDIDKQKHFLSQAQNDLTKQKQIYEDLQNSYDTFRGVTVTILVILSVLLMVLIGFYSSDYFWGLGLLLIVVDIILYNVILSSPNASKNKEKSNLKQQQNNVDGLQALLDRTTTELNNLPSSIKTLKKEFSSWAETRNELIDVFESKKLYQYLALPFEPCLDEQYRPIGTDENPRQFIVYSKQSSRSYKYHRLSSCSNCGQYSRPIEMPLVHAKEIGMYPCYTCCLSHFKGYEWIHTVQEKYVNAIEYLKKYDILVELAPNKHTRVIFLPLSEHPTTSSLTNPPANNKAKATEIKSEKSTATTVSQADLTKANQKISSLEKANQEQLRTIESLRADLSRMHDSIAANNKTHKEKKEKYEAEITRLKLAQSHFVSSESEVNELKRRIEQLQAQLKQAQKNAAPKADASEKDKKIEELQAFQDIFYPKMLELSQKYSTIFSGYPTLDAFYQQVCDKRFHRSLVEDLSFGQKINFECQVVSKENTYTTSLTRCSCKDFQVNKTPCKHMLFVAYTTGVILLNRERMEKNLKIYLDELRSSKPQK